MYHHYIVAWWPEFICSLTQNFFSISPHKRQICEENEKKFLCNEMMECRYDLWQFIGTSDESWQRNGIRSSTSLLFDTFFFFTLPHKNIPFSTRVDQKLIMKRTSSSVELALSQCNSDTWVTATNYERPMTHFIRFMTYWLCLSWSSCHVSRHRHKLIMLH